MRILINLNDLINVKAINYVGPNLICREVVFDTVVKAKVNHIKNAISSDCRC